MRVGLRWLSVLALLASPMAWGKGSRTKGTKAAKAQVTITHTPVAEHELGVELLIKSVITAPNEVYLPTVFYRLKGETQFFSTPMVAVPDQGGDLFATAIPGLFFTKDLEYYIEARDLKNFTQSTQAGTPDKPFRVAAVNKKAVAPRVAVTSDPPEAQIAVDGKAVGQTPFISNIDPGEHTFVVSKEKFKTAERTVMAAEGRDVDLSFPLTPVAKPPVLAVTSNPAAARVTLDDAELGSTPLIQDAPTGSHVLAVWLDGFQKQTREVSFAGDRDTELAVALQKLPPQPVLAVTTQPAGALLSIDGTEIGKTPYLGPLAAGQHEFALSREGYRGLGVEVVMPGDRDLDLRYTLETVPANPPPPQVAFGTDPSGAAVKVDGTPLGETPLLQPLPPGDHQVVISAKGFLPYTRKLWMPKDHDIEVSIALVPEPVPPGPSAVEVVADPETTRVTVDGKLTGKGKWSGKLEAGEHLVEAKAEGFRSLRQTLVVVKGQSAAIKLALTPLPPEAKAPLLTANSEPKGAKILFDGQELGQTPYTGDLKPGEHTITLVKPEFKNHDEKVSIPNDRDFELRIQAVLEPVRKATILPQVIHKAPPPPAPDAQQALTAEREQARKTGSPGAVALLQPTPQELAAMCPKPAPAAAAPPPAAAPSAPVRVEKELIKPGLVPIIATVAGLAAAGVGGYFAARAQSDANTIRGAADPSTVQSQINDYGVSQVVSLVLFGAGGLTAGGVDTYWLLRSYVFNDEPSSPPAAGSAGP